jgi:AraC-like DNA-binding protein
VRIEDNQVLHKSGLARIEKVCCLRARKGLSCEECKSEHQIAIPLSGVNVRHIGGEAFTIAPSHVTLSNRDEAYQVSHPYGSGETQLTIVLHEPVLRDNLGHLVDEDGCFADPAADMPFVARQAALSVQLHLAVHTLINAVHSDQHTQTEIDEAIIILVHRLLSRTARPDQFRPNALRDRQLASQAHSLLAANYSNSVSLECLARQLGVSVFHLCRVYRRVMNSSLWSQIQRLRIGEALQRLAEGERDLTALGLSLGYAHHSHFTAAFRRHLGLTPSSARQRLADPSLHNLVQSIACS